MKPPNHLCQSCHCLIGEDDLFCSNCGQKKITSAISLREMLNEFFSSIFSFDSKLIRTFLPLLFNPGKLTLEYLAGKRKLYYTPIRLFLAWMTIAFVLFNIVTAGELKENHDLERSLELHLNIHDDSLQKKLHHVFLDSIDQQKITQVFIDSKDSTLTPNKGFYLSLGPYIRIKYNDLMLLTSEELIKKHEVENWFQKQLVTQASKAAKNFDNFQIYLLSHISWIILFSVPFTAFLFKLLYIRRKRLYVEHLVYVLHVYSFIFALFSCFFALLLCQNQGYEGTSGNLYVMLGIALYFPLSLYRVYQQSKLKTFFKLLLFSLGYVLILIFAVIFFLLLNFLFF